MNKTGWRKIEPEPLAKEKPTWLRQAVLRCVAEGFVSITDGEQLIGEKLESDAGPAMLRRRAFLSLPLEERRKLLAAQADKLQKHYEEISEGWENTEADDFS